MKSSLVLAGSTTAFCYRYELKIIAGLLAAMLIIDCLSANRSVMLQRAASAAGITVPGSLWIAITPGQAIKIYYRVLIITYQNKNAQA